MAKGKNCPYCGSYMYAESEKDYPALVEVVYICRNSSITFEGLYYTLVTKSKITKPLP